ncbi:MAG TPA: efflux RND transporter periplasmic adaptor subunit [Bryobacteraceae bacterium]
MKRYWLLLVLPLLLLLWWGLGHGESAPTIHFSPVQRVTIESTVSTNGKVEPAESAIARAQAPGVVRAIAVQRGQRVTAGQTLVTLDNTAAQSQLAAAMAKEQEARAEETTLAQGGKAATLANLNDSITSAQDGVEIAQRNYDAMRRLAPQQAATKLQVENAKDALDKAKLQLLSFENQRKTLVTAGDRSVAHAKVQDAIAAVALARHNVDLDAVRAPLSGILYQFDLKVGAYLQPGDQVGLIGDLDKIKVTVYVDEPDLGRVGLDMPVSITWDAKPGRKWWGRVNKLPTQVIALGTRTVGEVTTLVDNPDHDLLPGVTVTALVISQVVKDAVGIPKAALRSIHGVNGAFRLNDKSLVWTPLTTGVSDVNNVQVVSGLVVGAQVADRVVEPSDAEIKNGMRVKPVFN